MNLKKKRTEEQGAYLDKQALEKHPPETSASDNSFTMASPRCRSVTGIRLSSPVLCNTCFFFQKKKEIIIIETKLENILDTV